jgi:hypothetical protein
MKKVLIFLGTFLFIQLMFVYIMGGFYEQTIKSKSLSSFIGIVLGWVILILVRDNEI